MSSQEEAAVVATLEDILRTSPKNARKPQERSLPLRQAILDIAAEYERMTLRQLFYQAVSRGAVEKTEQAYKRVADATVQLRLGGELPFEKIADGHRSRRRASQWDSARALLEDAAAQYRRNYWRSQPAAVEVWCEKDALTGVIQPICDEYGVTYVATRGFPSLTLLYETAQAIGERQTRVFYFGDHDASGHGISDGIPARLRGFGAYIEFERVALWPTQVEKYGLPTRPGKRKDTRQKAFVKRFGSGASVELDALPPDELAAMVRESIEGCIDWDEWNRMETVEERERETLAALARAKGRLRRKRTD